MRRPLHDEADVGRRNGDRMEFTNSTLSSLMAMPPDGLEVAAERANLCMEERTSPARQSAYEARMGAPGGWEDWRDSHLRYVQEEVRRRYPLSAAFASGEPSLRPGVEPNQDLYRVERIDSLLGIYGTTTGGPVGVEQIKDWIAARDSDRPAEKTATSFADIGRLVAGDTSSPKIAALQELTGLFNEDRSDGRPSFVAFSAEFPRIEERTDWAQRICERCGLAHFLTDRPVTLALFRYKVQDVLDARSHADRSATVFAVPTVIDHPMSNVYFTAPPSMDWGHAVGLAPEPDCRHLAAEMIHARMDYREEHWVAVDMLQMNSLSAADIARHRKTHLDCIRRSSGHSDYGRNC
ncbi:MAG: hypothetical protein OXQ29_21255 [Rhodospirillaceae bacterium]|nr:hypothetical protein [Rhodospirillaceae bacterium]